MSFWRFICTAMIVSLSKNLSGRRCHRGSRAVAKGALCTSHEQALRDRSERRRPCADAAIGCRPSEGAF